MEVAALAIAILALAMSAWAAFSAHRSKGHAGRSADAAAAMEQRDQERRQEELAPHVEAKYAGVLLRSGGAAIRGLEISVGGSHSYTSVTAEFLDPPPGKRPAASRLISLGDRFVGLQVALGPVVAPDTLQLGLDLHLQGIDAVTGGHVRIRLSFGDEQGRQWHRFIGLDIPSTVAEVHVPHGRIPREYSSTRRETTEARSPDSDVEPL